MSQSGEKTEQPTRKRLRDARRKGQVTKSQDLTSALLLIVAVAVLGFAGSYTGSNLAQAMQDGILYATSFHGELNQAAALAVILAAVWVIALALAPLFAALILVGLLANYLQVGSVFAPESVKPDINKLNPAEGFKHKFLKARPYIELAKTVTKITITAVVIGSVLWNARADLINLTTQSVTSVAAFTSKIVLEIGLKVGFTFLLLGAGDYFLQKYLYLKEMKMTKQEVKEDYKETEGNPLIKGARRQIHREILMQSIMAAVKKADAVVVNPTHIAVALQYDRGTMNAPTVVAKGVELMAAHIRQLADEAGVPIMRDVRLARALYDLELEAEVPEELYEAVAVVLRWVYQLAEERGEVAQRSYG
ncbi:MAG: flagellar biosynthesis protein FlhB [Pyrinomonadaceae bacterium]|nr:flagellar biosynthesis protein FlhB [Pyrinomonadaceae bacterium]